MYAPEKMERRETSSPVPPEQISQTPSPPASPATAHKPDYSWAPISGPNTAVPSLPGARRVSSANSDSYAISITPEQYERLFLQPSPAVGDLTKRLGNPTLLGLLGFVIPFQATMFSLAGFQGASSEAIPALGGSYFFFGGVVMVLAGIGEFILGNTFPFVLFISFGAHFCQTAYGTIPGQLITSIYGADGITNREYNAGTGFYYVEMTLMSACYWIAVLRTNACFLLAFTSVVPCFGFIAGSYFHIAAHPTPEGIARANYLLKIAGGFGIVASLCAWYLIIIMACASTGVPCPLPIFDLSHVVFANTKAAADERAGAGGGSVARRLRRSISHTFGGHKV